MKSLIAFVAIAIAASLVTIPAWAQTITLTNGPPNLSAAMIPAGMPSGSPVSDVYADNPNNSPFSGTFNPPTGANAASFSISTATNCGPVGNIKCGKLVTNGSVPAGTYNITLTTSQGGSQNVTINAMSGTSVACGSSTTVQNAGNAAGNGATLLFPACTYNWTASVSAPSNQTWVGIPGQTIFDAGGNNAVSGACGNIMLCGINTGTTGVTLANLTFQNQGTNNSPLPFNCSTSGGTCGPNTNLFMAQMNNGWTIQNSVFKNGYWGAVSFQYNAGSALNFINNVVQHMGGYGLIDPGMTASVTMNVVGNDLSDINFSQIQSCDGSGNKFLAHNFTLNWNFNYVHDNFSSGFWEDSYNNQTMTFQGNTWVRNGWTAIQLEVAGAVSSTIDKNVFIDNGNSAFSVPAIQCGLTSTPDIWVHGSPNVTITNNNFTQNSVGLSYSGDALGVEDDDCRAPVGQDPSVSNLNAHDNTVTFRGQAGSSALGGQTWGSFQACNANYPTSSNSSNNNHFHVPGGSTSDAHFAWMNGSSWDRPVLSLSGFQSTYGQDSRSTIDTTDAGANGCLHVACAVNPVGAGGIQQAPTLAIQNLTLSNNTFAPNTPNGMVGTVSVTMSDGSAFSGTLSITGANSGGFHLSGNTLQEKASAGTPPGTYHDFNIVATEANISNSPQQISPTVTGVVEAPFGGSARPITNLIQAEDYDLGGQGVAYNATETCGPYPSDSYRGAAGDGVNIDTTSDAGGGYKLGCNKTDDWHNYTITVPTTGTYTLNMRAANIEAGATYRVAIDGATVVSGIAVSNTGSYDTFATVTSKQFGLTAGQHVMQIVLDKAGPSGYGGDFNWVQGTLVKAGAIGAKNVDITVTH